MSPLPAIIVYYAFWVLAQSGYSVWHIDPSTVSQINYAFANIKNGLMTVGANYEDVDKKFPGDPRKSDYQKIPNRKRFFNRQNKQMSNWSSEDDGNDNTTSSVRILHVGGASWSQEFPYITSTEETRSKFVTSALKMIYYYGFDGIDIDWEFPTYRKITKSNIGEGIDGKSAIKSGNSYYRQHRTSQQKVKYFLEDIENFVLLLKEFYDQINYLHENIKDTVSFVPEISVAAPCHESDYKYWNISGMARYLSTFNLMCYDLNGPWSSKVGLHAPLYTSPYQRSSIDKAVKYFKEKGAKPNQIVVGMPLYGRSLKDTDGLGSPHSGEGRGKYRPGVIPFNELSNLTDFSLLSGTCFVHDSTTREFLSFDMPLSASIKSQYIRENNLGGAMVWEASYDNIVGPSNQNKSFLWNLAESLWTKEERELRKTISQNSYNSYSTTEEEKQLFNNICYPFSPFVNINGYCG